MTTLTSHGQDLTLPKQATKAEQFIRDIFVHSPVQASRLDYKPPLSKVFNRHFKLNHGPPSTAARHPQEIKELFPHVYGQPSIQLVPSEGPTYNANKKLKVGVAVSGGQAPRGHNVIAGIFDYLREHAAGSILYGFKGGPAGIMRNKVVEVTEEFLYPYRNQGGFDIIGSGRDKIETPEQFKQAEETMSN